ncbi:MAG: AraC family transcriptional regulator [Oceanospirillales bacterium LUC14_002_19_P2]|nr:MAG: AraC family transcriptional regulator [Oceanospirillales bacterium LUC14_002_19_P2]
MSELRDAGILVRMAHQAFMNAGIDPTPIYKRCNITAQLLADQRTRTPHHAQTLFWQACEDVTGDPLIGLHLGEHTPLFRGQVLEYLFLSSHTFEEGLQRALLYQRLLSDAISGRLEITEDRCALIVAPSTGDAVSIRHLSDSIMLGVIRFFQHVTDGAFKSLSITFSHEGVGVDSEYQRVFGCPVSFGGEADELVFDPAVLGYRSLHAEPELMRAHEQVASEQMARLEKQDVVMAVTRVIAELLDSGQVSLESVAERLEITARTLRSRLAEAETSFNQLLAGYRSNLARRLLARTDESIDEIVYLTGFSEPSTFYRVFKRWTGLTPIEYRRSKKRERAAARKVSAKTNRPEETPA